MYFWCPTKLSFCSRFCRNWNIFIYPTLAYRIEKIIFSNNCVSQTYNKASLITEDMMIHKDKLLHGNIFVKNRKKNKLKMFFHCISNGKKLPQKGRLFFLMIYCYFLTKNNSKSFEFVKLHYAAQDKLFSQDNYLLPQRPHFFGGRGVSFLKKIVNFWFLIRRQKNL